MLLGACGGGGGGTNTDSPVLVPPVVVITDADAARFCCKRSFRPAMPRSRPCRAAGYAPWLQQQMALPQGTTGWNWLNNQGYGDVLNPANYYDSTAPADYMAWQQLMATPDAVHKRMALALSEFLLSQAMGLGDLAQPCDGALLGHAQHACV